MFLQVLWTTLANHLNPRRGVMGISDFQPVGQKYRWQPGLVTEVGAWGGVSPEPCIVESDAVSGWTVSEWTGIAGHSAHITENCSLLLENPPPPCWNWVQEPSNNLQHLCLYSHTHKTTQNLRTHTHTHTHTHRFQSNVTLLQTLFQSKTTTPQKLLSPGKAKGKTAMLFWR